MSLKEFNTDYNIVPEERKKSNSTAILLGALLAGSLGFNAYQFVEKKNNTEKITNLNTDLESTKKDKQLLQTEFDGLRKDFDIAKTNVIDKTGKISQQEQEINDKNTRIQNILSKENASETELKEAKQLIASLKNDVASFKGQIATLKMENKKLTTQRDSVSVENKNNQALLLQEQQKSELKDNTIKQKEEAIASSLSVSNYKLTGLKVKNSGKEILTNRARRVNKLHVTFDLDKNMKTPSGKKDLYVAVYKPDGNLGQFAGAQNGSLNLNSGENVNYSDKVTINYNQGMAQNVSFDWKDHEFMKGDYKIDIYQNNNKIGEKTLTLK